MLWLQLTKGLNAADYILLYRCGKKIRALKLDLQLPDSPTKQTQHRGENFSSVNEEQGHPDKSRSYFYFRRTDRPRLARPEKFEFIDLQARLFLKVLCTNMPLWTSHWLSVTVEGDDWASGLQEVSKHSVDQWLKLMREPDLARLVAEWGPCIGGQCTTFTAAFNLQFETRDERRHKSLADDGRQWCFPVTALLRLTDAVGSVCPSHPSVLTKHILNIFNKLFNTEKWRGEDTCIHDSVLPRQLSSTDCPEASVARTYHDRLLGSHNRKCYARRHCPYSRDNFRALFGKHRGANPFTFLSALFRASVEALPEGRAGFYCVSRLTPLRLLGRRSMQGDMHRGKERLGSHGLHFGAMTTSLSVLIASLTYEEQEKNPCDRESRFTTARFGDAGWDRCGAVARALDSHRIDLGSRSPAGSLPDLRMWESCWTMALAGGFSRVIPASSALAFQHRSILGSHFVSCPGMTGTSGSQLENLSLGRGEQEIPEKTRRPAALSGMIPTLYNCGLLEKERMDMDDMVPSGTGVFRRFFSICCNVRANDATTVSRLAGGAEEDSDKQTTNHAGGHRNSLPPKHAVLAAEPLKYGAGPTLESCLQWRGRHQTQGRTEGGSATRGEKSRKVVW
ncbi:hypothetical protein PR048_025966 [Dryococelus australis]|uniref:Uncharacterized protein n=1 Tax=Dryococelus australis TaxID=614101 RepID=A0ABQ9GK16_9NEOP|nr:hypothetical protein PR048_025966 [Dryococelus australis]